MSLFKRKPKNFRIPMPIPDAEKLPEGEKPSRLAEALAVAARSNVQITLHQDLSKLASLVESNLAGDVSQGEMLAMTAAAEHADKVNKILQTPDFQESQKDFDGYLKPGMDSEEILAERAKDQAK